VSYLRDVRGSNYTPVNRRAFSKQWIFISVYHCLVPPYTRLGGMLMSVIYSSTCTHTHTQIFTGMTPKMCWMLGDNKSDQIIFRTKRLTGTGLYGKCDDFNDDISWKKVLGNSNTCATFAPKRFAALFYISIKMNKKYLQFFLWLILNFLVAFAT
jgi:hypothetical protein